MRLSLLPAGADLVAVVAAAGAGVEPWLLVADLDGSALDDVAARVAEQIAVLVADRERVQQQPADGVRDLGLAGDGIGDQLASPPEQVGLMPTSA